MSSIDISFSARTALSLIPAFGMLGKADTFIIIFSGISLFTGFFSPDSSRKTPLKNTQGNFSPGDADSSGFA